MSEVIAANVVPAGIPEAVTSRPRSRLLNVPAEAVTVASPVVVVNVTVRTALVRPATPGIPENLANRTADSAIDRTFTGYRGFKARIYRMADPVSMRALAAKRWGSQRPTRLARELADGSPSYPTPNGCNS